MNTKSEEQEQIVAIKNHLKEMAEYYSESFFDKNNLEGQEMEDIMKQMAEQIQHNEQCVTSLMDLVGMLILKCECFFQMQEENEFQMEDIANKMNQQLDFEKMSTLQFQGLYREQQEKNGELFERITVMENKLYEYQNQKQLLQRQNQALQKDKESFEANTMLVESIQKDYDQINNTLKMKNQELQNRLEIYEEAILNFSNIKDEMSEQIQHLTEELNLERAKNRALTKQTESLQQEIEQLQESIQSKITQAQAQAVSAFKRPSFLNTPRNVTTPRQPRPSLIPINAYSQLLQKDIHRQMPLSLKFEFQNHFPQENNLKGSDFSVSKRSTILPAILAQQLLTLNPQIIQNVHQEPKSIAEPRSVIVQTEEDISEQDSESSSLRSSVVSQKSVPYRQQIQESNKTEKTQKTENSIPRLQIAKPPSSQFANYAAARKLQLELASRTMSQTPSHIENPKPPLPEDERARFQSLKRTPQTALPKRLKDSMVEASSSQRRGPYEEFFILTSQCVKLNSHKFDKILKYDPYPLYVQCLTKKVPYNKWYQFIKTELESR